MTRENESRESADGRYQLSQAHNANIDFRIGKYYVPETADTSLWKDSDYHD